MSSSRYFQHRWSRRRKFNFKRTAEFLHLHSQFRSFLQGRRKEGKSRGEGQGLFKENVLRPFLSKSKRAINPLNQVPTALFCGAIYLHSRFNFLTSFSLFFLFKCFYFESTLFMKLFKTKGFLTRAKKFSTLIGVALSVQLMV